MLINGADTREGLFWVEYFHVCVGSPNLQTKLCSGMKLCLYLGATFCGDLEPQGRVAAILKAHLVTWFQSMLLRTTRRNYAAHGAPL